MSKRWQCRIALLAVAICALGSASAAQAVPLGPHATQAAVTAPTFPFGCRASVARVLLGQATLAEPSVANKNTSPCATDTALTGKIEVPTTNPLLSVGPAGAFTSQTGTPTVAPGAAAVADVQAINIPTAAGTISIVGPIEADAAYQCMNGKLTQYAQSTLDVIYVNGKAMTLPSPGAPDNINLGLIDIKLNQAYTTANSLTERVLEVTVPSSASPLADVIVGEATVTKASADPCVGTSGVSPTGGGASSTGQACPSGATLDASLNACVIVFNGQTIYVSPPFKGPTGGTVLPLSVARTKYHGPCLFGPGPNYVLVATKPHGRVTGTPRSDRILALGVGERVAGLAGNDCIDGQGGHGQKLFDGNGKNRVFGGPGANRIGVGNGNDLIKGLSGRGDFLSAGNGKDIIYGGKGNTRVAVGIGPDLVFGGPAVNHIWAVGDRAQINCGTGTHNAAWVRPNAAPFASSHGCQTIHLLKR